MSQTVISPPSGLSCSLVWVPGYSRRQAKSLLRWRQATPMSCECKGGHVLCPPSMRFKKEVETGKPMWIWNVLCCALSQGDACLLKFAVCRRLPQACQYMKNHSWFSKQSWKLTVQQTSALKKREVLYEVVHQFLQLFLHNILQFLFSSPLCFHFLFSFFYRFPMKEVLFRYDGEYYYFF